MCPQAKNQKKIVTNKRISEQKRNNGGTIGGNRFCVGLERRAVIGIFTIPHTFKMLKSKIHLLFAYFTLISTWWVFTNQMKHHLTWPHHPSPLEFSKPYALQLQPELAIVLWTMYGKDSLSSVITPKFASTSNYSAPKCIYCKVSHAKK